MSIYRASAAWTRVETSRGSLRTRRSSFITGLPDPELRALALSAGAAAFISEAAVGHDLLAAIHDAVDSGSL
jgi:hypothetical protein